MTTFNIDTAIKGIEKSLQAALAATGKLENATMLLVNGFIALKRDATPTQYENGMATLVSFIVEQPYPKLKGWDEKKAKGYLRQFVYEANQALTHGLVQDDGTVGTKGKDGTVAPITTLRELRKVNEAKRAEKAPKSASVATGAATVGDAALNGAMAALKPYLVQLVEHGKLEALGEYIATETGYTVSIYKK